MATNTATAVWHGNLTEGSGQITARTGAFDAPYSLKSRAENTAHTNPEEMIAGAHAGCLAMMLTALLTQAGHTATEIRTAAHVDFGPVDGGFAITKIRLEIDGKVPGIDEPTFMEFAQNAKENCPVSKALAGVSDIQLEARFHGG